MPLRGQAYTARDKPGLLWPGSIRKGADMIRTFEELYKKMAQDGYSVYIIKEHVEENKKIKKRLKRQLRSDEVQINEMTEIIRENDAEIRYIMGYLSCMEDMRYITPKEGMNLFDIINDSDI